MKLNHWKEHKEAMMKKKVYKEYAREYDYVRHLAEEKGILYVRYAFEMAGNACRGNYEDAKMLADKLKVRKEEHTILEKRTDITTPIVGLS